MERPQREGRGVYAALVEGATQSPILMETEAPGSSYEAAKTQLDRMLAGGHWFRGCIVRIEFSYGNEAVFRAMQELQK